MSSDLELSLRRCGDLVRQSSADLEHFVGEAGGLVHNPEKSQDVARKTTLRACEIFYQFATDPNLKEVQTKIEQQRTDQLTNLRNDQEAGTYDLLRGLGVMRKDDTLEEATPISDRVVEAFEDSQHYRKPHSPDRPHALFSSTFSRLIRRWSRWDETGWWTKAVEMKKEIAARNQEAVVKQIAWSVAGPPHEVDAGELVFGLEGCVVQSSWPLFDAGIDVALSSWSARSSPRLGAYRVVSRDQFFTPLETEVLSALCAMASERLRAWDRLPAWLDRLSTLISDQVERLLSLHDPDVRGWAKPGLTNTGEAWPTLSVFEFGLSAMRLLREIVAVRLCKDYGLVVEREFAADVAFSNYDIAPFDLTGKLKKHYIETRSSASAVLFGPPGTGKTSLVKAIAKEMGFGFLYVTPADLAQEGPDRIIARARSLFRGLREVEELVIMFDEFDAFIASRDGRDSGDWATLITTSMLPLLADLRDSKRCLFFLATNFVGSLDPAAVRAGRFDAILPLYPPAKEDRIKLLETTFEVERSEAQSASERLKWATYKELESHASGMEVTPAAASDADAHLRNLTYARPPVTPNVYD